VQLMVGAVVTSSLAVISGKGTRALLKPALAAAVTRLVLMFKVGATVSCFGGAGPRRAWDGELWYADRSTVRELRCVIAAPHAPEPVVYLALSGAG
jgi:hypothetical protein